MPQQPFNTLSDKIQKQKVAIYIRVSTHWQIDKDSLQVQKRELSAYAEMVLGISDYVVFEDPGYSAKNTDRPDYQRMMDRLRTGEFSHLLVWKIDRISRNLLDFAQMYNELKKLGITFVSKNEQFDTSSAIGEAMLKIILVFAELERNMTSERVTAVMLSRASNGQWNGGRVPYGYAYDKSTKTFTPHEEERKIVKTIYNKYEQCQSVLHVARYLNDSGFKTRNGNSWSATCVHKILTNIFYVGSYLYNVHKDGRGQEKRADTEWITIENHHEPIITQEQFDRIQFLLKRNKRGGNEKGEVHVRKNLHVFAGILRCGDCGANMSSTLDRKRADGWRPSIYACSRRRNDTSNCSNKYISDITLGPFVFNYIANIIKAQKTHSKTTAVETLQRKLLRGTMFGEVESISSEGLAQLGNLFLSGSNGLEYRPASVYEAGRATTDERQILEERKRKYETALNRLQSLYLYGDEETPQKDYLIERQKILNSLKETDHRLAEIKEQSGESAIPDDEFLEKAGYFIMISKLLEDRYVDYEKYIRKIDPSIPRSFIMNIIKDIVVSDGRVLSITFKNGMQHNFNYKQQ